MAPTRRLAAVSARPPILRGANRSYVCLNCQIRGLSSSKPFKPSAATRSPFIAAAAAATTTTPCRSLSQSRHYADNQRPPPNDDFEGSFADKLRKRIWGTDHPPGQRNPYVQETPEEREEREEQLKEEEEREIREMEERDFERMRGKGYGEDAVVSGEGQHFVDDVAEGQKEAVVEDMGIGKERKSRDYVPATTWRGLRHIPEWKAVQKAPQSWFTGFLARDKVDDSHHIERAIQRAIVEVWVMKKAVGTTTLPAKIGRSADDFETRLAAGVVFDKASSSLKFIDESLEEDVMRSLGLQHDERVDTEEVEEVLDHVSEDMFEGKPRGGNAFQPAEVKNADAVPSMEGELVEDSATGATEQIIAVGEPGVAAEDIKGDKDQPSVNRSFRDMTFTEPDVKFAVLKRVMQLTGIRIPDPVIPRLNTAAQLLKHLIKPPPAKRLINDLVENEKLCSLPNVELWEKRYTEKDKEVEIGRWKVIEAELQKRGLPLHRLDRG